MTTVLIVDDEALAIQAIRRSINWKNLDVERVLDEVIFLKDGQIVRQEQVDDIREKEGMSVDELFRQEFRAVPFEGGEWNVK